VAELVGQLSRSEAGLIEPGGHGLAEGVRGDPRPRSLGAADRAAGRCLARRRLKAGPSAGFALEGVQQLANVTGDAFRIAQRAVHRSGERQARSLAGAVRQAGGGPCRLQSSAPRSASRRRSWSAAARPSLLRHADRSAVDLSGAASRSSSGRPAACPVRRASASPCRAPVASIQSTRSARSSSTARLLPRKSSTSRPVSSTVSARGSFLALEFSRVAASRTGLAVTAPSAMASEHPRQARSGRPS
jgi:hypothetical protein